MNSVLHTARLVLVPITVEVIEAMLDGRRKDAESLLRARLPDAWPGRDLIERAFHADLLRIRESPQHRLWGDRVMIAREEAQVVGSAVFHGGPNSEGLVEIAYGVEPEAQGRGYATEGTRAAVEWALEHPDVQTVRAVTPSFHTASRRVLEKLEMRLIGTISHDIFGEVLEYERRRG